MKRLLSVGVAVVLGGAAIASGSSLASSGDQPGADAAVAEFNERMLAAGGYSTGAPDMDPVDPDEAEDFLPAECVGEFGAAIDPGGRFPGETARAISDDFRFSDEEPASTDPMDALMLDGDTVSAGVIVVDEESEGTLDEFVTIFGSEDTATCLEDFYADMMTDPSLTSDATEVTLPEFTFDVATESDLGIGDASARFTLSIESADFGSGTTAWVARTGRSLAFVGITSQGEQVSDIDGQAELEALVDAL
jgi:hypothetical protein